MPAPHPAPADVHDCAHDPLRVYVYVPQTYANRIRAGMAVEVRQLELVGQLFKGIVARTAGAIDPATRSMQVEVDLPNPDAVCCRARTYRSGCPVRRPMRSWCRPTPCCFDPRACAWRRSMSADA